jgi:hypothetical protein
MKFSQLVRKIWHDIFYRNASDRRVDFALNCKEVTARMDLHEKPSTALGHLRYWLHLSLCQACKNYHELSRVLSRAIKQSPPSSGTGLEKINKSLLAKYSRDKGTYSN